MPDSFDRASLATYEAPKFVPEVTPPPAAIEPEPVIPAATETAPAADAASSATSETPPVVPESDGSSDAAAESSTATVETDSETPEAEAGDGKPAPRSRAQERIEELVAERNALRKFGEYTLEQLRAERATKGAPATETLTLAAATADSDKPPTLEDSKFDPIEYNKKLTVWLKDQVAKGVATGVQNYARQQEAISIGQKFDARSAAFAKEHPDHDIVVNNPNLPKLDLKAVEKVVKSEIGPNMAYHLGKNPDLATRIARMAPDDQILAIGRLENQLESELAAAKKPAAPPPKPPQKTVTKAPPPPTPIKGNISPQKPRSEETMDEFVAREREEKIAQREATLKRRRAMR